MKEQKEREIFMKKLKRIFTALITILMCFCTFQMIHAEDTFTLSLRSDSLHSYKVYQVFTGDISDRNGEAILSNIKWGKNAKQSASYVPGTRAGLSVENAFSDICNLNTEAEKVNSILNYVDLTNPVGTVTKTTPLQVQSGYYLIQDVTSLQNTSDVKSSAITMIVSQNTQIDPKMCIPSIETWVFDDEENKWLKNADHGINESFQMKSVITFPDDADMDAYNHYYLQVKSEWNKGITVEDISQVKTIRKDGKQYVTTRPSNTIADWMNGPNTATLTWMDLKIDLPRLQGSSVEILYDAHLNADASSTNVSLNSMQTVYFKNSLVYSNDPDKTWNAASAADVSQTQGNLVNVFTYDFNNVSYANEIKPENLLPGIGFRLYQENGTTEIPMYLENGFYMPIDCMENWDEIPNQVELLANGKAEFHIKGLDTGVYYLKETTTPKGYNTVDPIRVEISASHQSNQSNVSVNLKESFNGKAGNVDNIISRSGITLPHTGDIGSFGIYFAGGILVLCATLLYRKNRTSR